MNQNKVKFQKEKKEYGIAMHTFLNRELPQKQRDEAYEKLLQIDQLITSKGDRMFYIVTTEKTNPLQENINCFDPFDTKEKI